MFLTCLAAGCSERDSSDAQPAAITSTDVKTRSVKLERDPAAADTSTFAPKAEEQPPPSESVQYRTPQPDPQINPKRLAAAGIHVLESERLILLTDRDPETVQEIPALTDALYNVLKKQCGELRPAPTGASFKAVGCLMSDVERFQNAGLVPYAVLDMRHGEQTGYRFWARDQQTDYYRRHLILHEFVHVYMTIDTAQDDVPNRWFMEGSAEYFATHSVDNEPAEFGIIPASFDGFEGWGRISVIRRRRINRPADKVEFQDFPSLNDVLNENTGQGGEDGAYPWWWALAWMLSEHPDYSETWNRLCQCRGADEFQHAMSQLQKTRGARLQTDWLLFVESLSESFDKERSFPVHCPVATGRHIEIPLVADRGWQDTGWELMPGESVAISCSGQCVLNETTAPWISEPNGITLEYNQGCPIGEVVAVLVTNDNSSVSRRVAVGLNGRITVTHPCRLWLQINDDSGMRSDNSGAYVVSIQSQTLSQDAAD